MLLQYCVAYTIIGFTLFTLSVFVYQANPRNDLNRVFAGYSFAIAWWSLWSLAAFLTSNSSIAVWFCRTFIVGPIFIPTLYLHFVLLFLKQNARYRRLIQLSYAASFTFLLFDMTPLFISAATPRFSLHNYTVPGPLFHLHVFHFLMVTGFGTFALLRGWLSERTRSAELKENQLASQLKYLCWTSLFGYLGGTPNYLLVYGLEAAPLNPFGNYAVIIYGLATAYIIFRYRFLDIEVIIKRTLVFAGLVASVVGVVSLVAFVSQDLLAHFIQIPKWLSNVLAAAIIAAVYGPLRNRLVNMTDKYLFQKKYDYKELLRKFTDEVMVMVDRKQLLDMTVKTLTETVKLDGCSLLLLNKDTRKYELAAARGLNGRQLEFEEQEPFITFLRKTHEPIGRDGQLGKVQFPPSVIGRIAQLNARLCLPLSVHDDLIGVLCLGKKKSDEEFGKDDLDILLPLARTLAIAISNAQLFEELAKTQAEAAQKEKLAVIGTLSAGINHEICNPLGIVKAQCEAFLLDLQDGILIGKHPQELLDRTASIMNVALKQIDRATAITQKLSNFAKPIKEPSVVPVSVVQEVEEVMVLLGHDLTLEKIAVQREMAPNLPSIAVDRRQLQEVLFNLIRNAGQAIKPPGTITVRAYTGGGDHVRVEIEDTGSGIAPDKLGKIYDPFFTTKEPGKGTGLGLFIVRQIVERNKGRISVESTVGKGTIFFLEFPVAKAVPVAA